MTVANSPSSFDGFLSTSSVRVPSSRQDRISEQLSAQTDSMVEIKPAVSATPPPASSGSEGKYRLVYTKSKVYVNPTAYARDNIPGFVALVKHVRANLLIYSSLNITSMYHVGGG